MDFLVKNVADATPETILFSSPVLFKNPVDWSRDGHWIVMTQLDTDASQNVYVLDASGKQPPKLVASSPVRENGGLISHDGKWMLFSSEESGRLEVCAQALPTPAAWISPWLEATGDLKRFIGVAPERIETGSVTVVPIRGKESDKRWPTPARASCLPTASRTAVR